MLVENIVIRFNHTIGFLLYLLSLAVFVYLFFRIFSRNLPARQRENEKWLQFWHKLPFSKKSGNWTQKTTYDQYRGYESVRPSSRPTGSSSRPKKQKLPKDKEHVYRICPACHANIRLPKKKGSHSVRCPACGQLFDIHI
jgi:hypothetical protein